MRRLSVVAVGILVAVGTVVTGLATSAGAVKPPVAKVNAISPNHGPMSGGTVVMIRGANLIGTTEVDFGSSPGTSIVIKSNSQIMATSPAEVGGTVDVTVVTSAAGTSAPNPGDQFTYTGGPTIQSVTPRIGADTGGTKVTISGTDFTGATDVKFGSISVPFTIQSNLAISTVAPAEAPGKVDITVKGSDGTTPIDPADVFTFAVRVPIVLSIAPQSGPAGTQVTITGSRFIKKGTTVSFGANATTTFTVVDSKTITATAPAGSGTVDIIITDSKGTSSSSSADQFTYSPPAT
jgi:hypothetical protein